MFDNDYMRSDEFLKQQSAIKFEKGALEHCKCKEPICACWDDVDYQAEAMEECFDLYNYVGRGLSKYNSKVKIDLVLDSIEDLFESILLLNEGEDKDGFKAV